MADDPRAIDVSVLADLVRIKNDEDLLADRLAKMEATREKVSAVVYRRVRADYEARKAALEAQARAPREKAGREYSKLRVLVSRAEKELEEARLDDEELEFRHSLGEFGEDDFATRAAAAGAGTFDAARSSSSSEPKASRKSRFVRESSSSSACLPERRSRTATSRAW